MLCVFVTEDWGSTVTVLAQYWDSTGTVLGDGGDGGSLRKVMFSSMNHMVFKKKSQTLFFGFYRKS